MTPLINHRDLLIDRELLFSHLGPPIFRSFAFRARNFFFSPLTFARSSLVVIRSFLVAS